MKQLKMYFVGKKHPIFYSRTHKMYKNISKFTVNKNLRLLAVCLQREFLNIKTTPTAIKLKRTKIKIIIKKNLLVCCPFALKFILQNPLNKVY